MAEPALAIDAVIRAHIADGEAVFVFPSEVAASAYADRLLAGGGGGMADRLAPATIPMERFIAWDSFLEEAVLPQQKDRIAISDAMRKMFAAMVLDENALRAKRGQPPLFHAIIYPFYAQYSASFASWVADILPQLGLWAECAAGVGIEQINGEAPDAAQTGGQAPAQTGTFDGNDAEAQDYRTLIVRYKQFLNDNHLFESAWEKPPFTHNGKRYCLFFTEALADFPLYRKLLSAAAPHVTVVETPVLSGGQEAFESCFLKNAKSEITAAALYIMNLRHNGVEYGDITVTSPDLETYEPYILDECAAHAIPVQNGSGKPLASYPAGRLFSALSACVSKKMALDAVSALLLNRSIPWKEESKIGALVTYGLNNNCVCSWEDEDSGPVDVWERAFEKKPPMPMPLRAFYRDLKHAAQNLCSANSFAKIRDRYFAFREKFIDTEKFQNDPAYFEANTVLGRCIAELSVLIQIEKKFPLVKVPAPWQFYIAHLNSTIYKTQSASGGVNLLPYRVSASIPSACHIILGANQNAMPQIFRSLSFLSGLKKRRLHIEDIDTDASEVFFRLHRFSSAREAAFFCSEETFSGFALPYNGLGLPRDEPQSLAAALSAPGNAFHPSYYQEEARCFDAVLSPATQEGEVSPSLQTYGLPLPPLRGAPPPVTPPIQAWSFAEGKTPEAKSLRDFATAPAVYPRREFAEKTPEPNPQRGFATAPAVDPSVEFAQSANSPSNCRTAAIALFASQKDGFDTFAARHEYPHRTSALLSNSGADGVKERIAARYIKNKRLVVSATALLPYYQCAFSWLFRKVYQIEDIDAETTLMSPFARGNMYHDILRRTFTRIKENQTPLARAEDGSIPAVFQAVLAESADDAFAALRESRESALTEELLQPQKEAVQEKCALLLEKLLEKFDACTVAEVEPEPEWEQAHTGFTLAGRPDLLLHDGNAGHYNIIDFKSGKTPSKNDCANTEGNESGIKNFQLPVYHQLAESQGYTPATAGFFAGVKETKIVQIFHPDSDDPKKPSFATVAEDFEEKTRRYVREVLAADFEKSCNTQYAACLRCDYRRICRTTSAVQRETRIGRKHPPASPDNA
ncbi:MAG: PD-(D/E)XK nuclease family protein [Spirochaetaceae bacterium]|jgi:hypothetical protein|nr:PD-(D/E)XK nuclease family protein [Spirochaetaceae bacterium]